jgi:hypothetical protein
MTNFTIELTVVFLTKKLTILFKALHVVIQAAFLHLFQYRASGSRAPIQTK